MLCPCIAYASELHFWQFSQHSHIPIFCKKINSSDICQKEFIPLLFSKVQQKHTFPLIVTNNEPQNGSLIFRTEVKINELYNSINHIVSLTYPFCHKFRCNKYIYIARRQSTVIFLTTLRSRSIKSY